MIGEEMRRIRQKLDIAPAELADWLGLQSTRDGGARSGGAKRVLEMEAGTRPISGPVATCMEAFRCGWRPDMDDIHQPLQRIVDAVNGLLVEAACATKLGQLHKDSGELDDALLEAGKGAGLARAGTVLGRVLQEVVDV